MPSWYAAINASEDARNHTVADANGARKVAAEALRYLAMQVDRQTPTSRALFEREDEASSAAMTLARQHAKPFVVVRIDVSCAVVHTDSVTVELKTARTPGSGAVEIG